MGEHTVTSFDDDLEMARRLDLALLRAAPLRTRFLAWWAARLRAFL